MTNDEFLLIEENLAASRRRALELDRYIGAEGLEPSVAPSAEHETLVRGMVDFFSKLAGIPKPPHAWFVGDRAHMKGYVRRRERRIYLSDALPLEDLVSTCAHEVRHIAQDDEGNFVYGGKDGLPNWAEADAYDWERKAAALFAPGIRLHALETRSLLEATRALWGKASSGDYVALPDDDRGFALYRCATSGSDVRLERVL